jgi:hypothetical protein
MDAPAALRASAALRLRRSGAIAAGVEGRVAIAPQRL